VVDASFYQVTTGILTSLQSLNSTSLLLQSVTFTIVTNAVVDNNLGKTMLAGGAKVVVDSWGFGSVTNSNGTVVTKYICSLILFSSSRQSFLPNVITTYLLTSKSTTTNIEQKD